MTRNFRISAYAAIMLLTTTIGCHPSPKDWNSTHAWIKHEPDSGKILVVFVHGVIGTGAGTWLDPKLSQDQSLPSLLAKDPELKDRLDVLVFEYDSPMLGSAGHISDGAQDLDSYLNSENVWTEYKKVVFVGHSMGGLVIRQFLVGHSSDYADRVPLIYLYSTPTNGAEIAVVASKISANPQLRGMFPIEESDYLGSLYDNWTDSSKLTRIPTYCAYEGFKTDGIQVVSRSSASSLCIKANRLSANHITIVKPDKGLKDERYYMLRLQLQKMLLRETSEVTNQTNTPEQQEQGNNSAKPSTSVRVPAIAPAHPMGFPAIAEEGPLENLTHRRSERESLGHRGVESHSGVLRKLENSPAGSLENISFQLPPSLLKASAGIPSSTSTPITPSLIVSSLRVFVSKEKFPRSRSNHYWYIWLELPLAARDQVESATYIFDSSYIRYPIEAAVNPDRAVARFGASGCDDSGRIIVELRNGRPIAADFDLCKVRVVDDFSAVPLRPKL